jgi:L-lactate dehydrogenase complex protein LldG
VEAARACRDAVAVIVVVARIAAVSARDLILGTIRRSLGVTGAEAPRRLDVATRLAGHPAGVVPARGQLPAAARLDLFARMVTGAAGTVERVAVPDAVPAALAAFLRGHNLPLIVRHGDDPLLAALPWNTEPALEVRRGASDGNDLAAVSHAFAAVAETGTVVLASGPDNPTTLNLLPDLHVVVVAAGDVVADLETVMAELRKRNGDGALPRAVNFITGPSRSADIEQTLILGAHGPRRLHVIVVGS